MCGGGQDFISQPHLRPTDTLPFRFPPFPSLARSLSHTISLSHWPPQPFSHPLLSITLQRVLSEIKNLGNTGKYVLKGGTVTAAGESACRRVLLRDRKNYRKARRLNGQNKHGQLSH